MPEHLLVANGGCARRGRGARGQTSLLTALGSRVDLSTEMPVVE